LDTPSNSSEHVDLDLTQSNSDIESSNQDVNSDSFIVPTVTEDGVLHYTLPAQNNPEQTIYSEIQEPLPCNVNRASSDMSRCKTPLQASSQCGQSNMKRHGTTMVFFFCHVLLDTALTKSEICKS